MTILRAETTGERDILEKVTRVGHATEVWDKLSGMLSNGDMAEIPQLYGADALYLEPYNPPHRGNLLIQAYLKDWIQARENIDIATSRLLESADGLTVAVEWSLSYNAAGRRWNGLPRSSWIEVDETAGAIRYQRDYS